MSKPPAFQLYAADFLVDTMDWSATQVGIYFRLLMYEWVNGSIPNDCIRMARIAGIDVGNFKKCYLQDIEKKFIVNGGGELINLRLEKTREKQENYRKTQSEAGVRGVEAKKKKGVFPFNKSSDPLSDPTSRNQALQSSSSSSSSKDKKYSQTSNEFLLAELLFNKILLHNPEHKKPNLQEWAKHIDRMLKIDKRTPDAIKNIIEWTQDNNFWFDKILGTEKLRKQFDQLTIQKTRENNNGRATGSTGTVREKAGKAKSDGERYPIDAEY